MTGRALGLVCNPYHRGGITRWMVEFAVEWRRQGAASWFVAPRPRAPFVSAGRHPTVLELLESYAPEARPPIVAPDVGGAYEFGTEDYRAAVYAAAVRGAVPAGVPLLVTDDPAAWRAGEWLRARHPLVGVMHGDDEAYYRLARRYAPVVSAMACVSRRLERRTAHVADMSSVPLVTIPCGTALQPLDRPADGDGDHRVRLAWVGRVVEEQKRVSDLPRIAAHLRQWGVDFVLDVVGDGPARESVAREVGELELSAHVRFHGWRSQGEVLRLLRGADVLLLPSNYEGMPVAVMEALGAGCGVVASRISGIEDYETHPLARDCYWVHEVGDTRAAARHVVEAAGVPRALRARRARALAEAEFSIESCVRRYAELLARLAPPRRNGAGDGVLRRLSPLLSYPIAAQRIARLWARGRYRRPSRPRALPHAAPSPHSD